MKKILAALAITAVFASCKKETVTTPASEAGKKLKQIAYSDNGATPEIETIGYDTKGQMLTYDTDDHIYNFSYARPPAPQVVFSLLYPGYFFSKVTFFIGRLLLFRLKKRESLRK